MRYMMLGCAALVLSACAKNQDQGSDRDTTPVAASQAPVSLDAFAGRWRVRAFNDAGDSIVGYELHATSDTAGWTLVFAGRNPIPVRVATVGGQLTFAAGPYESVLRRGVQVRVQGTAHLEGDSLVGRTIARYTTTGADSVLRIRTVGRRVAQ